MKILCIGPNFLHPTTKGGQIRTLGILRHLSRWHEIHYVAFDDPMQPEGPARAGEYSARACAFHHAIVEKRSLAFAGQLLRGLFSPMPVAVRRYCSPPLKRYLEQLIRRERFDRVVVDFLSMSASCPDLEHSVLFQHNVETMIWRRHAEHAGDPARKLYFRLQAARMFAYERAACRTAAHVIAVSGVDAALMRTMFGVENTSVVPTGVDVEYFAPPHADLVRALADLVFVGSMDWLPNVDGVAYFVEEILPRIRRRRPNCKVAIAGRKPPAQISALARKDPHLLVSGTVPDIRPFLWGSLVSIVPLRIGGGTRLKIYEAMAAGVPVVSTSVGAEGLEVHAPDEIRIADDPQEFAEHCLDLLESSDERARIGMAGQSLVRSRLSWEPAARRFERILEASPGPA